MTWQWWKDDKSWVPYDDQTNKIIETAFKAYTQNGYPSSFKFTPQFSPDPYVIDFTINKQINQRTLSNQLITRIEKNLENENFLPKPKIEKNLENENFIPAVVPKIEKKLENEYFVPVVPKIEKKLGNENFLPPAAIPSRNGDRKKGGVPLGIKAITSLLLPKEVWHINNIANLRIVGTEGLPPKCVAPHITMLDSFSSSDRFERVSQLFIEAASNIEPFEVTLKRIKYFTHGTKRGFTLYLEPEITPIPGSKKNPLSDLQRALYNQVNNSGCHWLESNTSPEKFTPHVSLGKVSTKEKLEKILSEYSSGWKPISFYVTEIYILSKLVHDTVVRCVVPLGKIPQIRKFDITPFPAHDFYSININWIPPGSSEDDLLAVFSGYNVVKAEVIFKTIELKGFVKGWGNVIFSSKEERDGALGNRFFMKGKQLELFPCD